MKKNTAPIVRIDGVRYYVDKIGAAPGCGRGGTHVHDEPHADGSPGDERHHHCTAQCERKTAVLIPVKPSRPALRHRY